MTEDLKDQPSSRDGHTHETREAVESNPLIPQGASPGTICQDCGGDNPVWFAPSPDWNLVLGGPEAKGDPGGMLCPNCYIRRAEAAGLRPTAWVVSQEAHIGADTARMDWLEQHVVGVAVDLVHGSRHLFYASPDDSYEGEIWPSDLRAKVDAALSAPPQPLQGVEGLGSSVAGLPSSQEGSDPMGGTPLERSPPGPVNCTHVLRREGKAYPRTCERCRLGPCPFYNNDGSVKS